MKAFSDLSEVMDCKAVQLQGDPFSATLTTVVFGGETFRFGRKGDIFKKIPMDTLLPLLRDRGCAVV